MTDSTVEDTSRFLRFCKVGIIEREVESAGRRRYGVADVDGEWRRVSVVDRGNAETSQLAGFESQTVRSERVPVRSLMVTAQKMMMITVQIARTI